MRKRRFFNTAGEKRKFYNNLRHFGQTRNLGIAALGLLPVLGAIGLVIMLAFAVMHFGPQTAVAIKGHGRLMGGLPLAAMATAGAAPRLWARSEPVHKKIMSVKQALADFDRAQEVLLQTANGEDGKLSAAQDAHWTANQAQIKKLHAQLRVLEDDQDDEEFGTMAVSSRESERRHRRARVPVKPENNPGSEAYVEVLPKAKFSTPAEQLQAVARFAITKGHSSDPRLVAIGSRDYVSIMEASGIKASAGLNEGVPSEGGFLVQTDVASDVLERVYDTGQLIPLCDQREISNAANRLKFNAIDETSRANGSRFGGIQSFWASEGQTVTPTKPKFRQGELVLNKLLAFCFTTDETLNDAAALNTTINKDFPLEFVFRLEDGIVNGLGDGQPLGFLNSSALIVQAKDAAQATGTITASNIFNMYSRMWAPSRRTAVWLIDQSVEPQLYSLAITSGTAISTPIYLPPGGISGNMYGTLFGRPVVPVEYLAPLGSQGDIAFVDLQQYILARKGLMQAASSMHVNFLSDEMCFRFTLRADGQSQWNKTLTPKSGGPTLSPFVVLQARP